MREHLRSSYFGIKELVGAIMSIVMEQLNYKPSLAVSFTLYFVILRPIREEMVAAQRSKEDCLNAISLKDRADNEELHFCRKAASERTKL